MKTATMFLGLFVVLAAVGEAGDVRVRDELASRGVVSFDNGETRVEFSRRSGVIRVLMCGDGSEVMTILPLGTRGKRANRVGSFRVTSSSKERAACRVEFRSTRGSFVGTFSLNKRGAIRIESKRGLHGVRVAASMRYGVLPSRYVDDCVYDGKEYPELEKVHVPAEYMFMGLMRGNDHIVVGAWPLAKNRKLSLQFAKKKGGDRGVEAFEVTLAGTEVWLGVLSAKAIWHEVDPESSWEDKDVALNWTRPFKASWKGQVTEFGVSTTYWFVDEKKRRSWRAGLSWITRPLLFDGEKGIVHFSKKKLPAKEKLIIYALEGHEKTPYRFLTTNLPVEQLKAIVDLTSVGSSYKIIKNPHGLIMAVHCAGRDQLKTTTFKVGAVRREREFLVARTDDEVYEAKSEVTEFLRYRTFFKRMHELLDGLARKSGGRTKANPHVAEVSKLLDEMEQQFNEYFSEHSPEEYLDLIDVWSDHIRNLAGEPTPEVFPEIMAYVNKVNTMFMHNFTRKMGTGARAIFQVVAYGCARDPALLPFAREVRNAVREQLKYQDFERAVRSLKSLLPKD